MHERHRERLDKKVKKFGLEMLEVHEQLEYILFSVIPRGDTNAIAHRLIDRFGTLCAVLNAEEHMLTSVEGVGPRTAKFLNSLPALLGIVERSAKEHPLPRLCTTEEIVNFAKTYFYGALREAAYILCLNSSYKLTAVNKISDGIKGETYIFPSKVAKLALLENASIVAVVHNHPCGNLNPSHSDIILTRRMAAACQAVEVEFSDSIIIHGDKYFSLRERGYLDGLNKEYK